MAGAIESTVHQSCIPTAFGPVLFKKSRQIADVHKISIQVGEKKGRDAHQKEHSTLTAFAQRALFADTLPILNSVTSQVESGQADDVVGKIAVDLATASICPLSLFEAYRTPFKSSTSGNFTKALMKMSRRLAWRLGRAT